MGFSGENQIIIRDKYTKKIYIKKLNDIANIDNYNFEIWSNIGWCKIKDIEEEINFIPMYKIETENGIIILTRDLLSNIKNIKLPLHKINNKWKITNEEAFVLGYFLKYGRLDNHFNFIIHDTSVDLKYITKFLKTFDNIEGTKSFLQEKSSKNYIIKNKYEKLIWNKYFSFCYNIHMEKMIPNIILNSDNLTQTHFLLGYLGQLNYDKTDPFIYLIYALSSKFLSCDNENLFTGLYFLCNNIGIKDLCISKNKNKYILKINGFNETKQNNLTNNYKILNISKHIPKTYKIILDNPLVTTISVGIGDIGISIK